MRKGQSAYRIHDISLIWTALRIPLGEMWQAVDGGADYKCASRGANERPFSFPATIRHFNISSPLDTPISPSVNKTNASL
jgi:hypothetical protein